jgi:RNA polymerase sigma-70 factor (ECF subfamily)
MIDIKYIDQCKNGDKSSFSHIYNGSAAYVFAIIKNYISDKETQKDVMQDSYAAIFSSISAFDESKGAFKNWIAKIVIVNCINCLKRNSKIQLDFSLAKVEEIAEEDYLKLDELSQSEIEYMLKDMPLGFKTVFLLSVIDSYSHKEIAELLNITPETSRSQLMRGINWIKKNLLLNNMSNKMAYGFE